ncbi:hypothetical protein QZM64_16090 [Burkholderia cepacia]|nr:hypothetical protein [Burkholderia cepacia]MDN7440677.1 hypothetical protein [Burkholderia cepacia]
MSDDHHDGDAGLTGQVAAGFDGTRGARLRVRCLVRPRRAFVLDRS